MKKNITAVCEVPELTIGIDLSDRTFRYCALNSEGKIVEEGEHQLDPDRSPQVSGRTAARARGHRNRRAFGLGGSPGPGTGTRSGRRQRERTLCGDRAHSHRQGFHHRLRLQCDGPAAPVTVGRSTDFSHTLVKPGGGTEDETQR